MFELYLYFNEQVSWPEGITEFHWVVFEPGMKLFSATHTLEPVAFEIMLMKMRAEEKAHIEYVNRTCEKPIRYWQDYDKEVKEYFTQHQEEIEKYFREMPWRKQTN